VIAPRVVPSLELIIGALVVSTVVGGGLGILAAVRHGRPAGKAVQLGTGLGLSVPDFWLAAVAAGVLGLTLNLFPAVGFTPVSQSLTGNIDTLTLPVLVLSVVTGSFLARHVSSAMAAALDSPYIRTAWAMGLPPRKVYLSSALRNAVAPVITFIPLAFTALVGGTVLVEKIFAIPGLGTEIVSSVSNEDYPHRAGDRLARWRPGRRAQPPGGHRARVLRPKDQECHLRVAARPTFGWDRERRKPGRRCRTRRPPPGGRRARGGPAADQGGGASASLRGSGW
jgi:ABC-type antimicrobial peptide transport system permease subunit